MKSIFFWSVLIVALLNVNLCAFSMAQTQTPQGQDSPKEIRRSGEALESEAIVRIQPKYPPVAKAAKISGAVVLEVTVDEEGSVISVRQVSGHPLLMDAAITAARGWKFKPTQLNGVSVKVIGIITFNFNLDTSTPVLGDQSRPVAPQPSSAPEYDSKEWKEFSPLDRSFSVLFPGVPKDESPPVNSTTGKRAYLYGLTGGLALYWVTYFDQPAVPEDPKQFKQLLDSSRDSLIKQARGKLLSDKDISLDGHPGREVLINDYKGGFLKARTYLVGQRAYQLVIATPNSNNLDIASKFLESFKLTGSRKGSEKK